MLILALAYHYRDLVCAEGLYSFGGKYCMTAEECQHFVQNEQYPCYAYKALKMCLCAIRKETSAMQYANYVCYCADDYRLSFYRDASGSYSVTCLSAESINSSMYQLDETNVYADYASCVQILNMYVLVGASAVFCVTTQECAEKDKFVLGYTGGAASYRCMAAEQCQQEMSYYAYSAVSTCAKNEPGDANSFDQDRLKEKIYDCG